MKTAHKIKALRPPKRGFLDGQMLIAMPSMRDERFTGTVVYICAHSSDGAMGIVINQPAPDIDFPELLVKLEIIPAAERIQLRPDARSMQILKGGPVETQRGFVLHTPDYFMENSTLPIDERVCLTATLDILKAIADGSGPASAVLALGYAGWGAGQLELEMQANGWLNTPADAELVFNTAADLRYEMALRRIGIEPAMLSMEAGHA